MGEPALKSEITINKKPGKKTDNKKSIELINDTHTSELIIGLCGPMGSRIHKTSEMISKILSHDYGYDCIILKLSDYIVEHGQSFENYLKKFKTENPNSEATEKYIRSKYLIDEGNRLRKDHGADFLAACAIHRVRCDRELFKKEKDNKRHESRRTCYIIDSIKNKNELQVLEAVYGDLFYCFGIFSKKSDRIKFLEKKMVSSEVFALIDRDSGEEIDTGQSVEDTFPLADFFIRDEGRDPATKKSIRRAFNIIFEDEITSPTKHESAMYHAAAASSKSSCLSRQVGACITDATGNVLSVGWNEAPKAFGGVYCEDDGDKGARCFQLGGECQNKARRNEIISQVVDSLSKEEIIDDTDKSKVVELLEETAIDSLIEFSRSIHAEMNAIIIGSQKSGDNMVGGNLYCTTFPCHNCARHIILAGIKEIYYIEPYQKSLALELHADALTENNAESKKVKLNLFEGVSPARYMEFFLNRRNRKNSTGEYQTYSPKETSPSRTISLESIPALEGIVLKNFKATLEFDGNEAEPSK